MNVESNAARYPHPPIVEAVAEVRLAEEVNEKKQKKASDQISSRYASSIAELQVEAKLDFLNRSARFIEKSPIYRLSSHDHTELCNITSQSIAWVRRAPYLGWQSFKQRFSAELPIALKSLGEPRVVRLGLRYVNRIDVKLKKGLAHYEDYLNFRIEHGTLLEPTQGFQWHLVKEFPEMALKAIVQSAVLEPEIPGLAAFSFDIDVFCDIEVPQKAGDILDKLEAMRVQKNLIFEAGITDQARESYI